MKAGDLGNAGDNGLVGGRGGRGGDHVRGRGRGGGGGRGGGRFEGRGGGGGGGRGGGRAVIERPLATEFGWKLPYADPDHNRLEFILLFLGTSWKEQVLALSSLALPENWGADSGRLDSYLQQMFRAVVTRYLNNGGRRNVDYDEGIFFSDDKQYMCFDTGLFTPHYEALFLVCSRNDGHATRVWKFEEWQNVSRLRDANRFRLTPRRFVFVTDFHELYFNPNIEMTLNAQHILRDNHDRVAAALPGMPEDLMLFTLTGGLDIMKKRVQLNSRTVVPQYYNNEIQLLLPLSLRGDNSVQLVIPIKKQQRQLRVGEALNEWNPNHWSYSARTVLSLDMAVNNARLLNRLESEWLVAA